MLGGAAFAADHDGDNCNDEDMTTYCEVAPSSDGVIIFDMIAEQQVQTIYIAQGHGEIGGNINGWQVYVFSYISAATNPAAFEDTANFCFTGYLEGLNMCSTSITGQYIVIPVREAQGTLRISELLAYDAPLINITSITSLQNMDYVNGSGD